MLAALCNGRQFGGGMKIAPDALLNDGYLELFRVDYIFNSEFFLFGDKFRGLYAYGLCFFNLFDFAGQKL